MNPTDATERRVLDLDARVADPVTAVSAWGAFLRARLDLIDEWDREGRPLEQIYHDLCVDPVQVQLLLMTARDHRAKAKEST